MCTCHDFIAIFLNFSHMLFFLWSFVSGPHHYFQGRFSSLAQYPEPPTERIFCCTLSQCPRNKVCMCTCACTHCNFAFFVVKLTRLFYSNIVYIAFKTLLYSLVHMKIICWKYRQNVAACFYLLTWYCTPLYTFKVQVEQHWELGKIQTLILYPSYIQFSIVGSPDHI